MYATLVVLMNILDELGLNSEDVTWQDLAACRNVVERYETDDGYSILFDPVFDDYENDEFPYPVRNATDEMCMSCNVQAMCYDYGKRNDEPGVWGGVYLSNGKVDRTRNEHKTKETWSEIREAVGKL